MSQLNTNAIYDASGGQSAQLYGVSMRYGGTNFVNRIINGDMRIDQRNNGASVTVNDAGPFTLDRWQGIDFTPGAFSVQQVTDAPAGFTNSLKVTTTTAGTPNASDVCVVRQGIEGFNIADFAFGSASAQAITLSFRVKSSLTGTFGGSLVNSAGNRSYPFSYTISAANTWETKTLTISGDTTGTWLTNNGVGINLYFDIGSGTSQKGTAGSWAGVGYLGATGATNLIGTLNATWQITGVQLEAGSVATPFERRPYGTELALCQRYLPAFISTGTTSSFGTGQAISAGSSLVICNFPVTTRVAPTGVTVSNVSHIQSRQSTGGVVSYSTITMAHSSTTCAELYLQAGSGLTAGNCTNGYFSNASGQILFNGCEL